MHLKSVSSFILSAILLIPSGAACAQSWLETPDTAQPCHAERQPADWR